MSRNNNPVDPFGDNLASNHLADDIMDNVDVFIFIFDVENIKPVWINEYFVKRFGYTNKDLERVTSGEFLSLFHPKSLEQFMNRIQHFEDARNEPIKTLYQLRNKDEEWVHMLTCSRVYKRKTDGSIKYLIGYAAEVNPNELSHHIQVAQGINSEVPDFPMVNKLSTREKDIVRLIASGFTDKEISEKLDISIHTTRTHRKHIISKLGLKNSAVLIKFAVEQGMV